MATIIPVFRIFDYNKTIEFYINWLGFKIDWEHRPENVPLCMQVSLHDVVLHLSEHHGDCCPGGKVLVNDFKELETYHTQLLAKNYTFNRPGLEKTPWDKSNISVTVIDPFGNRLIFNEII